MMLGLVLFCLAAIAVFAVLFPLSRRYEIREGGEAAVYKDQLAEIERDEKRGTIGEREAQAARVEVARRLLAVSEAEGAQAVSASNIRRRSVAILALVAVPLSALAIYFVLGRPDLPDRPLAARLEAPAESQTLGELVARVEAELKRRPDDGRGWDAIAPVYLRAGEFEKAAEAYANAIRLSGSSAEREAGHGEALVLNAGGAVGEDAKAAFERAVALEPGLARAQFYLARAAEQAGETEKAASIYRRLLKDAPADASYIQPVRQALAGTALGSDGQGPVVDPNALDSVTPEERFATIRGMVEGLEARLKESPRDLGSQLRLIRAWAMFGEADRAKAAAQEARAAFADDAAALQRISDLLLGLGVEDNAS